MTLPRLAAMTRQWRVMPPAALQLSRLARYVGLAPSAEPESARPSSQHPLDQAHRAGFPVAIDTLPDDPLLQFINHDIGLGQGLPL